jgi:bacteriophage N4 adsorption protein B
VMLGFTATMRWLLLLEHELLVFAVFWLVLGTLDEMGLDLAWLWLRLKGRIGTGKVPAGFAKAELTGRSAVLLPAWREAEVIGSTVSQMMVAWPQQAFTLYIGCYRNDPATLDAAMRAAGSDSRIRIVVHGRDGPSTKADCLNRLYRAICIDECRSGIDFRSVLFHDAEDIVHPAELAVIDQALSEVDFVQLPVRPELQPGSRWIAGHYADEFSESHAKAMVVRSALGAAIPAAGVGCGVARPALARLCAMRRQAGEAGPFAAESLTEDYELGLLLSRTARGSRFLRLRDEQGGLIATRSYFPDELGSAVRQKTRWVHGIALQGWERLGWPEGPVDIWMAIRDRRGPLAALVLTAAYALLLVETAILFARFEGPVVLTEKSWMIHYGLVCAAFGLVWRIVMRFCFTAAEYGWVEGLRGVARMPIANIIAIMAGRRALAAYLRSLKGGTLTWEKTPHRLHPAQSPAMGSGS